MKRLCLATGLCLLSASGFGLLCPSVKSLNHTLKHHYYQKGDTLPLAHSGFSKPWVLWFRSGTKILNTTAFYSAEIVSNYPKHIRCTYLYEDARGRTEIYYVANFDPGPYQGVSKQRWYVKALCINPRTSTAFCIFKKTHPKK